MKTLVILSNGKVLSFTVASLAEIYVQAYGGTIVSEPVYVDAYSELLV